jgi:WD40 repeat protein
MQVHEESQGTDYITPDQLGGIPGWREGIPVFRIYTCGLFTIEMLVEVPGSDPAQARYTELPADRLFGRGPGSAQKAVKILISQEGRYATKDWLRTHLREGQEVCATNKRLENILSYLRCHLLCLPSGKKLRDLVIYRRATTESGDGYQLAGYPLVWIDIEALAWNVRQACLKERFNEDALPYWEQAYQLSSRGTFLLEEPMSEWASRRREAVEDQMRQTVQALSRLYLARYGQAGEENVLHILLPYCRTHCQDEDALRSLLELLNKRGRYQEVLEWYTRLKDALAEVGADKTGKMRVPHQLTTEIADFARLKLREGGQILLPAASSQASQHEPSELASSLENALVLQQPFVSSVPSSVIPAEISASPFNMQKTIISEAYPVIDWGEAPFPEQFYGRTQELAQLQFWIEEQYCRLVVICGMGGIGKTSLAVRLVHAAENAFQYIFWRSLQQAPPLQKVLQECLLFLSDQQLRNLPDDDEAVITLLVERLRASRCLLIFDNCETIMQEGTNAGTYREEYASYGRFIRRVGETQHQSCLLLTSREKPRELARLEGATTLTHTLALQGIGLEEGRALLQEKGLVASGEVYARLLSRYGGNPLALKLIAEPILVLFNADIAAFLEEEQTVLSDITEIIAQQFTRLSERERAVMYWLAIEREPIDSATLWEDCRFALSSKKELLDALVSLRHRSLVEASTQQQVTLQPVVMEYVTESLVLQAVDEITTGNIHLLFSHALLKAQAREYLREAQVRLILTPLSEQLLLKLGREGVEQQCRTVLSQLHHSPTLQRGYTAGNVLNLLLFMQYDLQGYDFSHSFIRQAFLQGMKLTEVNFDSANFSTSVFTETFGCTFTVAFHTDGKRLAAGTESGEVRLWDVQSGLPLTLYQGHTDWVRSVAFHPHEEIIASGSEDQTIRLWDIPTGQCLRILQEHTNRVRSVAFSLDGRLLASGSEDCTVRLWDTQTGKCLAILQGHTDQVRAVAFHPNGKMVVSGSEDRTLKLWDIQAGTCHRTIHTSAAIFAVAFHPEGQQIVSGGDEPFLSLWDSDTGASLNTLQGHTKRVRSVAFNSDGQRILSGSEDQTAKVWDTVSGRCVHTFAGHTNAIFSVTWSLDDAMIASGGEDQTVQIWDTQTGGCLKVFRGYTDQIRSIAFGPDGSLMVSGSEDHTVRLWDARNGHVLRIFVGHQNRVRAVAFSPDGKLVASGSEDQTVRIWDVVSGQCLKTLQGHANRVRSVAFSPDSKLVASGSEDQKVYLWNVATGQRFRALEGHTNRVRAVAFSPDGKLVASGSEDQTVRIWDVVSGQCLKTLQGHANWIWSISFSPNGKQIASGSEDRTIRLWDVESGQCRSIFQGHTDRIRTVSFSADSSMVASGSEDQTVRLWNIASGSTIQVLQGHTSWVWAVAFSPVGQTLASGSHDGTIKLWDIQTGRCLSSLRSQRPYERMNIAHATGLTPGQRMMLYNLGAVEV